MSQRDFDAEFDAFGEICDRANKFLNLLKEHSAEMIEGLTMIEMSALTAAVMIEMSALMAAVMNKVEFELWVQYNRTEKRIRNAEKQRIDNGETRSE